MLEELQIETTSNCNAACPGCLRDPSYKITNIPKNCNLNIGVYEKLISDLKNTLKLISFNGNYGDSLMHPHFLEMMEITASLCPNIQLMISTNGSYRNPDWWKQLAKILSKFDKSFVVFGIDGIDNETHSRYRVNTSFDKILINAKAFIDEGGIAIWKMIPFEWNAIYENRARELANEYGFAAFKRNKTSRYWKPALDAVISELVGKENKKSNLYDENNHDLYKLNQIKQIIKSYFDTNNIITTDKAHEEIKDSLPISCQWEKYKRVQISHDGTVWRCCHIEARVHYFKDNNNYEHDDANKWKRYYGSEALYEKDWNNLNYHSIYNIMNHQYFIHDLPDSLTNSYYDVINPKLKKCTEKCAKLNNIQFEAI
jgi:hypothetical protein